MVRLTSLLEYRTKTCSCCLTFLANMTLKNRYIAYWVLTIVLPVSHCKHVTNEPLWISLEDT